LLETYGTRPLLRGILAYPSKVRLDELVAGFRNAWMAISIVTRKIRFIPIFTRRVIRGRVIR
jgi:hypothetical protein